MVPKLDMISTTILLRSLGIQKGPSAVAPQFYDLVLGDDGHAVQAIIMMTCSVGLHIGAIRSLMSLSVQ